MWPSLSNLRLVEVALSITIGCAGSAAADEVSARPVSLHGRSISGDSALVSVGGMSFSGISSNGRGTLYTWPSVPQPPEITVPEGEGELVPDGEANPEGEVIEGEVLEGEVEGAAEPEGSLEGNADGEGGIEGEGPSEGEPEGPPGGEGDDGLEGDPNAGTEGEGPQEGQTDGQAEAPMPTAGCSCATPGAKAFGDLFLGTLAMLMLVLTRNWFPKV